MIMWLTVRCFSVSDKHGQTSNVIWLSTMWLLIFRLEVAIKKSLFTKPANTWIKISCSKDITFYCCKILYPNSSCYRGKMLLENVSKFIKNWFLTLNLIFFKLFAIYQNGRKTGHGWALEAIYLFML